MTNMKKIKLINRGLDEQLEIDGENIGGVDHLTIRQLLRKLEMHGIFELEVEGYDDSKED